MISLVTIGLYRPKPKLDETTVFETLKNFNVRESFRRMSFVNLGRRSSSKFVKGDGKKLTEDDLERSVKIALHQQSKSNEFK